MQCRQDGLCGTELMEVRMSMRTYGAFSKQYQLLRAGGELPRAPSKHTLGIFLANRLNSQYLINPTHTYLVNSWTGFDAIRLSGHAFRSTTHSRGLWPYTEAFRSLRVPNFEADLCISMSNLVLSQSPVHSLGNPARTECSINLPIFSLGVEVEAQHQNCEVY